MVKRRRIGKPEFVSFTEKSGRQATRLLYPLQDADGNFLRWVDVETAHLMAGQSLVGPFAQEEV
jgi:hypothetical protein